jgi:hypothetical protein
MLLKTKGQNRDTRERSRYLYENKGKSGRKAGMLMKNQEVRPLVYRVIGPSGDLAIV